MLKTAQTKWINRLMAKTSIQDALLQYDQQLRDAAMSFQVRSQLSYPVSLWGVNLSVSEIRLRR
jgi:hypothetical protein